MAADEKTAAIRDEVAVEDKSSAADGKDAVAIYDEIEIEDMTFDAVTQLYHYPCPCGDRFQIALEDLHDDQDIAVCPSCSLMIRVIFDLDDLPSLPPPSANPGGTAPVAV